MAPPKSRLTATALVCKRCCSRRATSLSTLPGARSCKAAPTLHTLPHWPLAGTRLRRCLWPARAASMRGCLVWRPLCAAVFSTGVYGEWSVLRRCWWPAKVCFLAQMPGVVRQPAGPTSLCRSHLVSAQRVLVEERVLCACALFCWMWCLALVGAGNGIAKAVTNGFVAMWCTLRLELSDVPVY